MPNLRKPVAATALMLTLSFTAQAGWMSTGAKPSPDPTSFTETYDDWGAETPALREEFGPLEIAFESAYSAFRSWLTLL